MKPVEHRKHEPEVISRITELLIKQGKTQKDLTEHLGLNKNNFTEWKAGRKRSYLLYIDEISRYLNVSPTDLLRGEPELNETQMILNDITKDFNSSQNEALIEAARMIRRNMGSA